MEKKRKLEVTALIIETICLSIISISNIAEFFLNPDRTGLVSVRSCEAIILRDSFCAFYRNIVPMRLPSRAVLPGLLHTQKNPGNIFC